ncbi:MAG TPA: hypothetical protein VD931_09330, partial [Baekduia sp.]|nr:hypothetical protein [Baekduia sp.]
MRRTVSWTAAALAVVAVLAAVPTADGREGSRFRPAERSHGGMVASASRSVGSFSPAHCGPFQRPASSRRSSFSVLSLITFRTPVVRSVS